MQSIFFITGLKAKHRTTFCYIILFVFDFSVVISVDLSWIFFTPTIDKKLLFFCKKSGSDGIIVFGRNEQGRQLHSVGTASLTT
jgi:hypothetical protein